MERICPSEPLSSLQHENRALLETGVMLETGVLTPAMTPATTMTVFVHLCGLTPSTLGGTGILLRHGRPLRQPVCVVSKRDRVGKHGCCGNDALRAEEGSVPRQ